MYRYHLIALLFTAITCAAQPPSHTIMELPDAGFYVFSETKLADGRYVACGWSTGERAIGFVTYDPRTGRAYRSPLQSRESRVIIPSLAESWTASDGSVLSVCRDDYYETVDGSTIKNQTIMLYRYVPGSTSADKINLLGPRNRKLDLGAATMAKNDIVYFSLNTSNDDGALVSYDKTLTLRRSVQLDFRLDGQQALLALSDGDILMVMVRDSTIKTARFDPDLNLRWSRSFSSKARMPSSYYLCPAVTEKSDGSIVIAYGARVDGPIAMGGCVFHHLGRDGGVRASWIVPYTEWGGDEIQQLREDADGDITAISQANGGVRERAVIFKIAPDSRTVAAYIHLSISRPDRSFNQLTIGDAGKGRVSLKGITWGDTITSAAVEWNVGGEMPCDMVVLPWSMSSVPFTEGGAWISTLVPFTPEWWTFPDRPYVYGERELRVNTYPCTAVQGTTSDSMVLAGEAYQVEGVGRNPALIQAIRNKNTSGVVILDEERMGRSKLIGTSSMFNPEIGVLADIETSTATTVTKLVGSVLVTQENIGDSLLVRTASAMSPSLIEVTIPVPRKAKLLDVLPGASQMLLASEDSLFVLKVDGGRATVVSISFSGRPVYALDGVIIVENPLGTLWLDGQSYYIGKADGIEKLFTLGNGVDGYSSRYAAVRLSGSPSEVALVDGVGGGHLGVRLPSSTVDSVVVFRDGTPSYFGQPIWAIGTIGNDACIIGLHPFTRTSYYLTYQRIPREGARLVPRDLEQRPNGTMILWCEAIMATGRSYVGIPTNSIGQTLCSTGWQRVIDMSSIAVNLHLSPERGYTQSYMSYMGRANAIPALPYRMQFATLGSCGFPVSVALPGVEGNVDSRPAVRDAIPFTYVPTTVRSYTIRDIQGRIVRTVQDVSPGRIPTHDLPPGVYVMVMEHDAGKITSLPFMVMQR